jgi:hypothetical protein
MVRKYRYNEKKREHKKWGEEVRASTQRVNDDLKADRKRKKEFADARARHRREEDEQRKEKKPEDERNTQRSNGPSHPRKRARSVGDRPKCLSPDFQSELESTASGRGDQDPDARRYYIFKGESYVHGFMDGEALRAKFYKEKGAEDQVFELR